MAYSGYSVWSLIVQSLILQFLTALLLWYFSKFRPAFIFSLSKMKVLFDFSLPLLGTSTLTYLYRNIDSLLIGKKLGSDMLGLYNKSYALMSLPLVNINNAIGKAAFPSFAQMQDDKNLIKNIFFQAISAISIVTFPIMTMASILSFPIIEIVYGVKWLGCAQIFCVLAIAGTVQSISSLNGNIYLAFGKTKLLFKVGIMTNLFFIIIIIFSLQWGVIGVSFGILAASIIVLPVNWYFINKILLSNWMDYFRSLFKITLITVINSLILYFLFCNLSKLNSLFQILTVGILGGILYFSAYEFFQLKAYIKLKDLFKSKFLKKKL
jgi:O-antigen/teichoic acid export membrane protein